MSDNSVPLLETQSLTHVFADKAVAIKNINLKVNRGDFIIIAGANGSGKTVFVRHLNGLLTPSKGKVLIDGVPIQKNIAVTRRRVGLIFQDSNTQIIGQTVAEDVAFGPLNLTLPVVEVKRIVQDALAAVGLTEHANRNPHTLSSGQKKRLAIAGVLAMRPDIIIFDEPFTGLDYPGVIQILQQLVDLHQAGYTIILITHELEKALAHANRLIVLDQGELVVEGSPAAVIHLVSEYGVRMPLEHVEKTSSLTWLR
ncbi:MAG: energy-coupling factor ABC transporter ATP-binding protein [Coriobacteriales bacterium]|jgi:biotin transport system ATP-binding protein|nr:energy-coupling factor ABC transporter ATP-binding protein [Coriobacteriales bacterium]